MLLERGGRGHFHRDPHEEKMILDKLGELGWWDWAQSPSPTNKETTSLQSIALLDSFVIFKVCRVFEPCELSREVNCPRIRTILSTELLLG